MNKLVYTLSIFLCAALLFACNKNQTTLPSVIVSCDRDTTKADSAEVVFLDNWIQENNVAASKDPNGFYYKIVEAGSADSMVKKCTTIKADYKGYTLTGGYVDDGTNTTLPVHKLIAGWQQGLTYIGKGGKIKLYIPPSLAYGKSGQAPAIGPNEYLIFELTVVDMRNTNP